MAEVDKAVQTLQNMWYMAVVDGLGLDKSSFMLLQPGSALPYTTSSLWQMIDSLPAKALTTVLSLSSLNSFYQNYGGLFSAVIAPMSDDFRRVMSDDLPDWMNYKKTVTLQELISAGGWTGLFEFWARQNLADNKATTAISVFNKDDRNIVNVAFRKYSTNSDYHHPFDITKNTLYNIRIDDIVGGAIVHGPRKEVHMNSRTSSADVSSTWAKGGVSGFFNIFNLGGSGSFSQLTNKFTRSEVTIDASFQHIATLPTFTPGGWYDSSFLNYAYKNKDTWSTGNPMTWETTFGPGGNMQRFLEGLVVVDGIDIVMTSDASYTLDEQKQINAQASSGLWPFFCVNASGGYSSRVSFNDQGKMTMKTSCPVNNPAIFGANVRSFSDYLSVQKLKETIMEE